MVTAKPIIVVLHATSKQGSSVIIALLETDKFAVKGITRDVNGDSAAADSPVPALDLQPFHCRRCTGALSCRRCAVGKGSCGCQHPPVMEMATSSCESCM